MNKTELEDFRVMEEILQTAEVGDYDEEFRALGYNDCALASDKSLRKITVAALEKGRENRTRFIERPRNKSVKGVLYTTVKGYERYEFIAVHVYTVVEGMSRPINANSTIYYREFVKSKG